MESNPYPLQRKWAIWEMWNQNSQTSGDPAEFINKVGEFDGLHEFWQHWNYLHHANPSTLFENPFTKAKLIIESINQAIEAIGVFESGVEPLWNDPSNVRGSDFYFEIDFTENSRLKDLWDKLVFTLIGETFNVSEEVVGCRVVDKKNCYKFEIWCKFDGNARSNAQNAGSLMDNIRKLLNVSDIKVASHSNS
jgi:hypothetical protein